MSTKKITMDYQEYLNDLHSEFYNGKREGIYDSVRILILMDAKKQNILNFIDEILPESDDYDLKQAILIKFKLK